MAQASRRDVTAADDLATGLHGFAAISCDVFDTAVVRRLARPEDVHLATGLRLAAAGLSTLPADAFREYRVAAEAVVRRVAAKRGEDEPRIAEVYDYLAACAVVSDPAAAARVELAAEIAACMGVAEVRAALAGRAVLFVSDSILPGAWIAELLVACGYPADVAVISSADFGASKHSGRLFGHAVRRLGRPAREIVHVGDNPLADGQRAREAGLATVALPPPRRPPEQADIAALHPLVRLLHSYRRSAAAGPVGAPGGYEWLHRHVTALAIAWSLDVLETARRLGVGRIYFLARDGWLPMQIARVLAARRGEAFEMTYLEVSRAAVVVPQQRGDAGAAREYLAQTGFSVPGPRVVVDVGWHGSIQTALTAVAGLADDEVFGCYLGLRAEALRPGLTPRTAQGLLFGFGHPRGHLETVMEGYALLELLFSAPHGSVRGYRRGDDGGLEPVHAEEPAPDGAMRSAMMQAVADGVLAEFDAIDGLIGGAWQAIDATSALHDLVGLLTRPTRAEVDRINRICFINAPSAAAIVPLINPMGLRGMILRPREALRRAANSPWRSGWIRLHTPWPLPALSFATLRDRARRLGLAPAP